MAASYLRPQLLRSSKAAFECAFCAQRRSTQFTRLRYPRSLCPPLSRSFATRRPSEDPEKQKKKQDKAEKADKPAEEPEKSQNEQPGTQEANTQQFSQLTPDEVKQINDVAQMIKTGLPKSQADAVDEAAELMKKGGIPQELRDVLEERRNDPSKRIDLGTTVRLVGLLHQDVPHDSGRNSREVRAEGGRVHTERDIRRDPSIRAIK